VALANGSVDCLVPGSKETCQVTTNNSAIVDVRLHPDRKHWVAAVSDGSLVLGQGGTVVATLSDPSSSQNYSAGALHPDGLIYVAGDGATGNLLLWDFKGQAVSATLPAPPNHSGAVTAVACSNNGYHIAAAYANDDAVLVWDLRKQTVLNTLNNDDGDDKLVSVTDVQFDDAGKYVAYCGNSSDKKQVLTVCVAEVKKGNVVARFQATKGLKAAGGLVWGKDWIAAAALNSKGEKPQAVFFGV